MPYQPNYCNNCGEKVERIDWRLWTSTHFCENCELNNQKVDWLPKIFLGLALIGGLFGFGSYLKTPDKNINIARNETLSVSNNKAENIKSDSNSTNVNAEKLSLVKQPITANIAKANLVKTASSPMPLAKQLETGNQQNEANEVVYFCGAPTKKGTPCTRKVKNGGRCWQHIGLPALLPKEKLVASQ